MGVVAGCSKKAIITKKDGSVAEGRITQSDASMIYVEGAALSRADIVDIDHPGNVAATVSTSLAAIGLAVGMGVLIDSRVSEDHGTGGKNLQAAIVGIPFGLLFVASLPPAIWGWVVWGGSRSRTTPPDSTQEGVSQQNESEGLGLETGDWGPGTALRFLGIAPVAGGDRDLKGVVVGFQF